MTDDFKDPLEQFEKRSRAQRAANLLAITAYLVWERGNVPKLLEFLWSCCLTLLQDLPASSIRMHQDYSVFEVAESLGVIITIGLYWCAARLVIRLIWPTPEISEATLKYQQSATLRLHDNLRREAEALKDTQSIVHEITKGRASLRRLQEDLVKINLETDAILARYKAPPKKTEPAEGMDLFEAPLQSPKSAKPSRHSPKALGLKRKLPKL